MATATYEDIFAEYMDVSAIDVSYTDTDYESNHATINVTDMNDIGRIKLLLDNEATDYGYATVETSEGLGLEVWEE